MSAYKRVNNSDVVITPYIANKQWNFNSYDLSSNDINIYLGTKLTGSFSTDSDPVTYNRYERLVYDSINHLYYHEFSGSYLDDTLNLQSNNYESASIYRLSGSYFDYSQVAYIHKNFPTASNSRIWAISIPKDIFGIGVEPGTFNVSMSNHLIVDDGKQNLLDIFGTLSGYVNYNYTNFENYFVAFDDPSNIIHVGNIFYEHGMAIITNQDYYDLFELPPLAKGDSDTFYDSTTPKIIDILSNDLARTGTIDPTSVVLSGSAEDLALWTNNLDGTLTLNTLTYGTYTIYYTVDSVLTGPSCSTVLTSNKAKVTVLVKPDCTFDISVYIIPPPSTTTTTTTTSTTTSTTTIDCGLAGNAVEVYPTTTTTTTSTTTTTTTTPLIDNCINPLLHLETIGAEIFLQLSSIYPLTSNVNVAATVTTQYASYGPIYNLCPIGSSVSQHKYLYTSGNPDESAISVSIDLITPSSDSTYNYVNCI